MQSFLQSEGVWKSVVNGYTPPKKIKTTAQKEAKRSNELALKIIQRNLSEAMKNEMKSITSAKEVWLRLEQIYKEHDEEGENKLINMVMEGKSKAIREKMRECKTMEEFEDKIFKLQQLEFEEVTDTGRYTGNFLKPPLVVFEDSLKIEKCYHGNYDSDSDRSDYLCHLDDRVNMYIESDSESENGNSIDFDFDVECNRNLTDVKSNILSVFERLSKNK